MNVYNLQKKLLECWKQLAPNFLASDVKKQYNDSKVVFKC
jgi:hypothetical protein